MNTSFINDGKDIATDAVSFEEKVDFIINNVNSLQMTKRIGVLQHIINSNIEIHKIREKSNGSQIRVSDLSTELIIHLYNFIYNNLTQSVSSMPYSIK